MRYIGKGKSINLSSSIVGKITDPNCSRVEEFSILKAEKFDPLFYTYKLPFIIKENLNTSFYDSTQGTGVYSFNKIDELHDGDYVIISPNGSVSSIFIPKSEHNSLYVTSMCNNNCIMCSQPPCYRNDIDELYNLNCKLLDLLDNVTAIGITGGEPTLLGSKLYFLLEKIIEKFPACQIHILTNARTFVWDEYARLIGSLGNSNISFGIPFLSDSYQIHNFISQQKNSFPQSLNGIYNLANYDQRIELRIILQQYTVQRIENIGKFIIKNLPFIEQVSFMGLEMIGRAQIFSNEVWVELEDFLEPLVKTIDLLILNGFNVCIFNLPFCLLPESLWPYCIQSISEWKRSFFEFCDFCRKRNDCGGVFFSTKGRLENNSKVMEFIFNT